MDRKGAETALRPENVGLERRGLGPRELRPAWLRLGRAGKTWGGREGARGGKDHRLDRGCMALTFWSGLITTLNPMPTLFYENRHGAIRREEEYEQVQFVADFRAVGTRILMTDRSLAAMAYFFVQPMEYIRDNIPAERYTAVEVADPAMIRDIRVFLLHAEPRVISSRAIRGDGQTRDEGGEIVIRISADIIEEGAAAYFDWLRPTCVVRGPAYRRAVLCAAAVYAYEMQHYARMTMSRRAHPSCRISFRTPPKVKALGTRTRTFKVDGQEWRTGEGGWSWEEETMGGRLLGIESARTTSPFRGHLCAVRIIGINPPLLGSEYRVSDAVVDSIVLARPFWWTLLPLPARYGWFSPDREDRHGRMDNSANPLERLVHSCENWEERPAEPDMK
ncbi:uncharacterized protein MKK02DRAFT_42498 [Dioszegia hungarica]|uniref:Uncharacterized protein n=1 Tax=Dioszegia hungarica TaxID=4972 RepID=A0AA38HCN2_9TREE|nr:uncharacterized protein MKK02DRAFT_42498 [Dioszegia hungarica]KAI9638110.1 hypothetical protein MKK02DRAFT_42498 [Dioszegia hungarica]